MRFLFLFLIATLCLTTANAQSTAVNDLVSRGIELYDKGDYTGAVVQYKSALVIEPKSSLVNYELALTYFAMKDYDKTLVHCNAVLKTSNVDLKAVYGLKGSAEDLLGRPKDAIKTYKEGIEKYPDNYLLYYNLALTQVNDKQYKAAEEPLKLALRNNPNHASSHLLLSNLMRYDEKRVPAMLALYNFLLLEPISARAKTASEALTMLFEAGVKKVDDKNTSINLNVGDNTDEFSTANMMVSLIIANQHSEANKDKTPAERFALATDAFLSIITEMKKEQKGFWWDYYVSFYQAVKANGHIETYAYLVNQANNDEAVVKWLAANSLKVDAFVKWYEAYKR